jgi:hypothetical protein
MLNSSTLTDSKKLRLQAYALLTGGLATLGTAQSADAEIAYFDPPDETIMPGGTISIDFASSEVDFGVPGADFNISFLFGESEKPNILGSSPSLRTAVIPTGTFASKFSVSDTIGASMNWAQEGYLDQYFDFTQGSTWNSPTDGTGYLGVRLETSSASGDYRYGWVQIDYDDENDKVTLFDYAINTTVNQSIAAGSVPEPSSLLMFAAGMFGLARRRRSPTTC